MQIVGVSFGGPDVTARWVENQEFPYEVWTDLDKTLALHLGAAEADSARPRRITVVLDAEGRVLKRYDDVAVGAHPEEVLEDIRGL